jgi:sortase B
MNRELSRVQRIVFYTGLAVMTAGMIGMAVYGISLLFSAKTNRELREAYEQPTATAQAEATQAETNVPAEETPSPATAEPAEKRQNPAQAKENSVPASAGQKTSAASARTAGSVLPAMNYPNNPGKQISSYFQNLQQMNREIVGWLKMGGIVDEAVVQRDNEFYLDHDAMGRNNVNGALFMDAGVNLDIRPYSYIIYGHNMRAGAEFGSLRNYEKAAFYRADPFISLNTVYEEGRYVIFAIDTVNVIDEKEENFVDFLALMKNNAEEHREAIRVLQERSIYPDWLDVRPEDQLLLLVTCVSADDERRIVAARRIRDNERETDLIQMINDVVR